MEIEDSIMTVTQKEEAIIETPLEGKGLRLIWGISAVLLVILGTRIFYLSVIKGGYYADLSKGNRIRSVEIKAPRGEITDKFGSLLASNMSSVDAIAIPNDLPEEYEKRENIFNAVSKNINVGEDEIREKLGNKSKKSLEPVLLKENISHDQALMLAEKKADLPGIAVENTAIRNYVNSFIFSSLIGYEGKITKDELAKNVDYSMTDYIGKTGLEKYYEKELKGKNGAKQVEVDSMGNIKKNLGIISPVSGADLILNIDEGLQKKLYDSLTFIMSSSDAKTAAAVAIDPRNGAVLALVSLPSFDNNMFARGITSVEYQAIISDKNLPLFNRVINGEYPPGSTLKPAIAAAALAEGIITKDTTVNDYSGAIHIGSWRFGDWKTHGVADVQKAIAESCDVFFYAIGGGYGNVSGLGMTRMKKYENLFGFGNPTRIDLFGESSGFIPDEQWKINETGEKWYVGNSYHAAIGQGFITATPAQLANFTAAIANGGTLYKPRIVNWIKKAAGESKQILPEVIGKVPISDEIIDIVKRGMRQTVASGTAQQLNSLPIEVAGKTGTAEFGVDGKTHGWFISFAPFENPEIAMAIIAEGGGDGHSTAVPVTREAYEWYFRNKDLPSAVNTVN